MRLSLGCCEPNVPDECVPCDTHGRPLASVRLTMATLPEWDYTAGFHQQGAEAPTDGAGHAHTWLPDLGVMGDDFRLFRSPENNAVATGFTGSDTNIGPCRWYNGSTVGVQHLWYWPPDGHYNITLGRFPEFAIINLFTALNAVDPASPWNLSFPPPTDSRCGTCRHPPDFCSVSEGLWRLWQCRGGLLATVGFMLTVREGAEPHSVSGPTYAFDAESSSETIDLLFGPGIGHRFWVLDVRAIWNYYGVYSSQNNMLGAGMVGSGRPILCPGMDAGGFANITGGGWAFPGFALRVQYAAEIDCVRDLGTAAEPVVMQKNRQFLAGALDLDGDSWISPIAAFPEAMTIAFDEEPS